MNLTLKSHRQINTNKLGLSCKEKSEGSRPGKATARNADGSSLLRLLRRRSLSLPVPGDGCVRPTRPASIQLRALS